MGGQTGGARQQADVLPGEVDSGRRPKHMAGRNGGRAGGVLPSPHEGQQATQGLCATASPLGAGLPPSGGVALFTSQVKG